MKHKIISLFHSVAVCALLLSSISSFAEQIDRIEPVETISPVDNQNIDPSASDIEPQAETVKGIRHEAIVVFGEDVELKAGDTAESVIVIGGSAKILGTSDECVVIGGDLEIAGTVHQSAVVVGGVLKALPGAALNGDVVGIGNGVEISQQAKVTRKAVEINLKAVKLEWLKEWLVQCVLKMRPLAPQVHWV